jgi:hypothetical protein
MRPSTPFVGAVLSVVALVSFAAGAELRFHLDFSTCQVRTADAKPVLVDRSGGLQAELHNIGWMDTPSGKAALFNGRAAKEAGSYVVVPSSTKVPFLVDFESGPFTIEVWFRPDPGKDYRRQQELINTAGDTGPGYRLTYSWRALRFMSGRGGHKAEGKPDYWSVVTNPATHKVVEEGWNHVVVVRDEVGLVTLFLNGVVAARSEKPFPVTRGRAPLTIGAYLQGYAYPLSGAIGEVRISRGAKTAAEVYAASQDVGRRIALNLDGKLDEPLWQSAKRFGDFRLRKGGRSAPVQTSVLVAHDAACLYLGVTADEPKMADLQDTVREHSLKVCRDDCIEIMLDADGNRSDFYHFLINPSGYRGQEMRVQTGLVSDTWENGNWFAAAAKGKDRWTVEIAIPLASLDREDSLVNQLRFNVARNRRADPADAGSAESSLAGGGFNTPGRFLDYNLTGVDLSPHRHRISTPVLADTRMADGRLQAQIATTLKSAADQPAELRLSAALISSAGGQLATYDCQVAVPAGQTKALRLPFSLTQPGQYRLVVCLHRGADLALVAEHVLPIQFVPMAIDVTQPFYRNSIYPTEDIRQLQATVRIGLPAAEITGTILSLALKDAGGKVRASTEQVEPAIVQPCRMSLPDIAVGTYPLTAQLKREGKVIAEVVTPLRKLGKAPGREVRIDQQLRMVVDGRPILPIVWWAGASFEEIAQTGSDGIVVGFTRNSRPMLDQLQAVKQMGCVMLMEGTAKKQLMEGKTDFTPAMRRYVSDAVRNVIDHPAMLCWYLVDEPEGRALSPDLLQCYYQLLAELDPYHPILITNNTVRGLYTYAACQDMFVPDPYVLPVKGGGLEREMTYVPTLMTAAQEAGKGRKLLGLTPQVFNYGDYGQYNGRAPTFTEQRCMQYLGIVHGCRMFNYFIYRGMKGYPDLGLGVPILMREIRAVTPVILEGSTLSDVGSSDRLIHVAAWKLRGQLFAIACNAAPKTVVAEIAISGATGQIQVVSESRQLLAVAGHVTDTFEPYATHIYTTDTAFHSPVRLGEVENTIKAAGGLYSLNYGN